MILLNTSFHIVKPIEPEFLAWLNDTYLPALEKDPRLTRVTASEMLSHVEPDTASYCVQAFAPDLPTARDWLDNVSAPLLSALMRRFGPDRLVFLTSLMQTLDRDA